MMQAEIIEKGKQFSIDSKVVILERIPRGNGYESLDVKTPAVVIERYPHILIVEKDNGVQESFTYADIVLFNALKLKR